MLYEWSCFSRVGIYLCIRIILPSADSRGGDRDSNFKLKGWCLDFWMGGIVGCKGKGTLKVWCNIVRCGDAEWRRRVW